MEGLYFYGFTWGLWIISTFLFKKTSNIRLPLAIILLFILILSPYNVQFGKYTISYVSFFMLLVIFLIVGTFKIKKLLYFFITTLIMSVGYVTFLLFELFDPIWIIFKREILLSFIVAYLAVLLQKKVLGRIFIIIVGGVYGDILFSIILFPFSFPYDIGSLRFLDVCALAVMMIFGWEGIKMSISYMEGLLSSLEKEKQKTT
jgi:hypothetical protein